MACTSGLSTMTVSGFLPIVPANVRAAGAKSVAQTGPSALGLTAGAIRTRALNAAACYASLPKAAPLWRACREAEALAYPAGPCPSVFEAPPGHDGLLQKQIQEHRRHGAISGENLLRCVEPSFLGLVCRSFHRWSSTDWSPLSEVMGQGTLHSIFADACWAEQYGQKPRVSFECLLSIPSVLPKLCISRAGDCSAPRVS